MIESLEEKGLRVHEDLLYIEQTQAQIERLSKELGGLQKEAETLYVFGHDQAAADTDLKVSTQRQFWYRNMELVLQFLYKNAIQLFNPF